MIYELDNGKHVTIPDVEVKKLMDTLNLKKQDAIDLWLSDNGLEEDLDQIELDEKASKVKIDMDVIVQKPKKERKKPEIKVSDQKKLLFNQIFDNLKQIYGENVKILNENKLISIKVDDISFKVDLIQQRPPKN